jgi:hypothetical protein
MDDKLIGDLKKQYGFSGFWPEIFSRTHDSGLEHASCRTRRACLPTHMENVPREPNKIMASRQKGSA